MQITVTNRKPMGVFDGLAYILVEGIFEGTISGDEALPGIRKSTAKRYSAAFQLQTPEDPTLGNGTLLLDLPNRGVPCGPYLYNSPIGKPLTIGSVEIGSAFFQKAGYIVASLWWEPNGGFTPPYFEEAGKRRMVEAAALVAIRDFVFFLRTSAFEAARLSSPLSLAVKRALGVGWSQTGRLLKTLVLHGYHVCRGMTLLEGIHHHAGPVGWLPIFQNGEGPGSSATYVPDASHPDVRGVIEEPLTPAAINCVLAAAGLPVPKFIFSVTSLDYYILRASLFRTGAVSGIEQSLPSNVRLYDIAGGTHAIVAGGGCTFSREWMDWRPLTRAFLLLLDSWVSGLPDPPPSALLPLTVPPPAQFHLGRPAHFPAAQILVPMLDKDGHPTGGIRMPWITAPLGTHGLPNDPVTEFGCFISGAFTPFADTAANRMRHGDARLSLAERYDGYVDYINKFERGIIALEEARLLRRVEREELLREAERKFFEYTRTVS